MNHSELKFQYVHISNWTLWLTAISLMSQVPAPSYGVALAQFKALILWTFTGRFAGRLCIRNPKSKGIVWIWPQGMKFVELAISLYGVSKRGSKQFFKMGIKTEQKIPCLSMNYTVENRHFEPKVMEVDGELMIFLESIGWWKWFQSLPQGTNPCDILNVKPCLGLQQHLNLQKILARYCLLSPKSSQSLSKCSKSWTLDQQPSLPKDRMAPVTLMAAWL